MTYLIWSSKHYGYWKVGSSVWPKNIEEASLFDAEQIRNTLFVMHRGVKYPTEIFYSAVPAFLDAEGYEDQ